MNPGIKRSRRRKLKHPQCFLGSHLTTIHISGRAYSFPSFRGFPQQEPVLRVMRANDSRRPYTQKTENLPQPTTGALWGSSRRPRHPTPSGLREQDYALNSTKDRAV